MKLYENPYLIVLRIPKLNNSNGYYIVFTVLGTHIASRGTNMVAQFAKLEHWVNGSETVFLQLYYKRTVFGYMLDNVWRRENMLKLKEVYGRTHRMNVKNRYFEHLSIGYPPVNIKTTDLACQVQHAKDGHLYRCLCGKFKAFYVFTEKMFIAQ